MQKRGRLNRLGNEKSAYLQHAKEQKIDWYPWSEEAFERAKMEEKPVFLSSGAQWCHWCHVMAEESFEDQTVAELLNEHFISIKLDRDERPDVDRRYQQAVAAMGFGGGWPLSVFLTPDKLPFYGGTYFPPEESYGRPGFKAILSSISALYRDKKEEIAEHGEKLLEMLKPGPASPGAVNESAVAQSVQSILSQHDEKYGGFGKAPKFPMSGAIEFLINRFFLTKEPYIGAAVKKTLEHMAEGGIHDQLGGGFHRYSTDPWWIIPHFEKMTDDNAWLLRNYTDGYAVFRESSFMEAAKGILDFFMTELSHPEGGFYASQDADVTPQDEGGYFTWTEEDLKTALDETEYRVLSLRFIHPKGSMHHDASKKVLAVSLSEDEIARRLGMEKSAVVDVISRGRKKLLDSRNRRQKPFIDNAFYTGLNGLAISAFLKAYRILGAEEAKAFALKSIDRIIEVNMPNGRLLHSEGVTALLDDYVFFCDALVAAYEVTGDVSYLERARSLMDLCLEKFWDEAGGGFFDTEEELIGMRLKGIEDIPHPSANSLAVLLLIRLAFISGQEEYRAKAKRSLESFSRSADSMGLHGAYYLAALDGYFNMCELSFSLAPGSDLAKAGLSMFYPYEAIRYGEDRGVIAPCVRGVCFEPATNVQDLSRVLATAR
jgi:uncharacterized protein